MNMRSKEGKISERRGSDPCKWGRNTVPMTGAQDDSVHQDLREVDDLHIHTHAMRPHTCTPTHMHAHAHAHAHMHTHTCTHTHAMMNMKWTFHVTQ